jgi:hypothetical protein
VAESFQGVHLEELSMKPRNRRDPKGDIRETQRQDIASDNLNNNRLVLDGLFQGLGLD